MWYCVHAILYFEYKDGNQGDYVVWEHLYLIKADNPQEAGDKGKIRAKQDEGDSSGGLTVNERPARLKYAGIRKIVDCQDLDMHTMLPTDGTELSYSELIVESPDEFEKLISGDPAAIIYNE